MNASAFKVYSKNDEDILGDSLVDMRKEIN